MTHSAIHFSFGALAASCVCLPPLARRLRGDAPLAPGLLRWLGWSLASGVWAVAPALLLHAGLPPAFCHGWWMNLFMLHPFLSRLNLGGTITATAALVICFGIHYGFLLLAVRSAEQRRIASAGIRGQPCRSGC